MIASEQLLVSVSAAPLDVAAHERAVTRTSAGAHVVFCGVVRDVDQGRRVVELEYEAYPAAEKAYQLGQKAEVFFLEADVKKALADWKKKSQS